MWNLHHFFISVSLSFFVIINLQSQNRGFVSSDYDRNAMTILVLNAGDSYAALLANSIDSLKVPVKYFDNSLLPSTLPIRINRGEIARQDAVNFRIPYGQVGNALSENGIGRKIIAKWFDRRPDGSFGVKTLAERGVYNATDNDLLVANASKRGTAGLMDMGMSLVDKSYVIAIDVPVLNTMEQIYDRDTVPAEKRTMNGFQGKMNVYVFKLDFSEPVATNFFENLWVTEGSTNKAERVAAFNNTRFQLNHISTFTEDAAATQLNPGQKYAPKVQQAQVQLLKSLLDMGLNQALFKLEKTNESFRVKAMIADVKPIAVKIGKKEGLRFDQRYFVYENLQNRRGQVYSKRRGVIRAMSVANNLQVAEGSTKPSYFYQVAGRKLDALGMFVEQKNALGFNLYLGYLDGGLSGAAARMEILISPIMYEAFAKNGKISRMTAFKIYVEGAYDKKDIKAFSNPGDYAFTRVNIGLSKEMRLTRNSFFEPKAAYGFEFSTPPGDYGDQYESHFIEIGANLGLNIGHSFQLMPSLSYFSVIKCEYKETEDSEPVSVTYSDQFEGREGVGIGLGLRFMF
jgi:hypothetical protein